jgi:hypothetical protein
VANLISKPSSSIARLSEECSIRLFAEWRWKSAKNVAKSAKFIAKTDSVGAAAKQPTIPPAI